MQWAAFCRCFLVKHIAAVILGCLLTSFSHLRAAPANDDWANRFILEGTSILFTGTVSGATIQYSGQNVPESESIGSDCEWGFRGGLPLDRGTVWWEWTAPISATGIVEVIDYSTNVFRLGGITVYQGTNGLNNHEREQYVRPLACTILDSGRRSYLQFAAVAGEKYQIRVSAPPVDGSFTLRLTATNAPHFLVHPVSQSATVGNSVFFGGLAVGPAPVSYQWRFKGVDLPGQNLPILVIKNLTTNQSGDYVLVASNAGNVVASQPAQLYVTTSDVPPELALSFRNGQHLLGLTGETGRLYRIQSTTDLVTWTPEVSFPETSDKFLRSEARVSVVFNTNGVSQFGLPSGAPAKFFRAVRYDHDHQTDECLTNLKSIRFAKELWLLTHQDADHYIDPLATPSADSLAPYLGPLPNCPNAPTNSQYSYTVASMPVLPICSTVPWLHSLYLGAPEY
jgi:hypothetical protein